METYIIRVNGREYAVEVEKITGATGAGADADSGVMNMAPAVTAAPAAAPQQAQPAQSAGEPVTTGTTGKVWKITGSVGDSVKRGDTILILEAMKMEIPIVAPVDGKIGAILVSEGDSVETGQTVATVI
ncbi:MAG: biotin/lipoyl-binding protein [Firmicutes bacterium]|nr:biotin/lipoyl-binding protein [Bacillota bacterium]